jgi:hypothetical protein
VLANGHFNAGSFDCHFYRGVKVQFYSSFLFSKSMPLLFIPGNGSPWKHNVPESWIWDRHFPKESLQAITPKFQFGQSEKWIFLTSEKLQEKCRLQFLRIPQTLSLHLIETRSLLFFFSSFG